MKYKYNKMQKTIIGLEVLYTIGCILNLIIIHTHGFYGSMFISNIFHFLGLTLLSIIIVVVMPKYYVTGTYNDTYIKNNHPDIWKLLHFPGRDNYPQNRNKFCKGCYDDGTDEQLNQIQSVYYHTNSSY